MEFLKKTLSRFEWHKKIRRLQVSRAGKWYLVLTVALGVVSLASGNNVIYLIESLLLSGLILSGVLSEQTISAVRVEFFRMQAQVGHPTHDFIVVHNTTRRTLFCLEIGEWKNGEFKYLAFIPHLPAQKTVRIRSEQVLPERGHHHWDGFAIATSYPFGFARKIKVVKASGSRLVWPEFIAQKNLNQALSASRIGNRRSELELIEGELRAYDQSDDARLIVAKHSAKGLTPVVRNRRPTLKEPEIILDMRSVYKAGLEDRIIRTAAHFYLSPQADLILIEPHGRKKLSGQKLALNTLAMIGKDQKA